MSARGMASSADSGVVSRIRVDRLAAGVYRTVFGHAVKTRWTIHTTTARDGFAGGVWSERDLRRSGFLNPFYRAGPNDPVVWVYRYVDIGSMCIADIRVRGRPVARSCESPSRDGR